MQQGSGHLRHELLTWEEVDRLIDILFGQISEVPAYDALLLVTRGGIIPGGMLAEALGIRTVLTAAVRFTDTPGTPQMAVWPEFIQFPGEGLLEDQRTLVVDDVWGSGRTSTAVRGRVEAAGGIPSTCVMHYNPYRSLFTKAKPDFFGAVTDAWIVYPWELDRGTDRVEPTTSPSGMN